MSSSTSTKTSIRCRSDSSAASCGSVRTCVSLEMTIRRSTSGVAARCRTSSRSPSRYPGVRQVILDDNFRSSQGVVELGRSVAERIPAAERLPKAMVAAGHQTWERGDLLALDVRRPGAEAAWIVDRIEHLRGVPFQDGPESRAARSVVVGLRRAVPVGREGLRARRRRASTPRYPVYRQGPEPTLRQSGDPGRRRHLPIHGRERSTAEQLKALWDAAALIPAGADWANGA